MTSLISKILPAVVIFAVLTACAPPATLAPRNLSLEMRQLQTELSRQGKAIEELTRQLSTLESRVQQQTEKAESSQAASAPLATGLQADQWSQPSAAVTEQLQVEGSPTEVYLQAFGDYASGRYQAATRGFETFLQRFPNNSYASNARFWVGDCYFNQQQYALAIPEFERVLNDYPSAAKAPDALLKIATAHLQLGTTAEARRAIDTLNRQYPKSTAAQKAQELTIP